MKSGFEIIARENGGVMLDYKGQTVLILKGSPYQMGYCHGKFLKEKVRTMAGLLLGKAEEFKPGMLAERWEITERFIPERYKDEMKGLADGAGLSAEDIYMTNIFPELFHCSGTALYGKASKRGALLHGRILDYEVRAGLQEHSVVILAKPDGYRCFLNAIFAGLIGSVTGMNDRQIAIGEMGVSEEGGWAGVPMTLLVRMALEETDSLDGAVSVFRDNKRTCAYCYVISDGKIPDARAMKCTCDTMDILKPGEGHPELPEPPPEDVVIISRDERYTALLQAIKANYGMIDRELLIEIMKRPVSMEANLHNAIFEPQDLRMWLAVAKNPDMENFQACYQTYFEYDMKELMKIF